LRYRSVPFAELKVGARINVCNRHKTPGQEESDAARKLAREAFQKAQKLRQSLQPPWIDPAAAKAFPTGPPITAALVSATEPAASPAAAVARRGHNVTLVLSAQRCGSNWISRMVRQLGVRPFGQEAMLDFCTTSRSAPKRPLYGQPLDRCLLKDGDCKQCNRDKPPSGVGAFTDGERRAYCSEERYRACVDPLLGHGHEQGRGKFGFLIKSEPRPLIRLHVCALPSHLCTLCTLLTCTPPPADTTILPTRRAVRCWST
jgi:hypothetical protein